MVDALRTARRVPGTLAAARLEVRSTSPIDSGRTPGSPLRLDGVHPTTIGYGIIAREVMHAMAEAGVAMANAEPDFHKLLDKDTLISKPPVRISSVLRFVELADRSADLYQALATRAPV